MIEKVKELMKIQEIIVCQMLADIGYLQSFSEVDKNEILERNYLIHIGLIASNNFVIGYYKLMEIGQHYSFCKLINVLESSCKSKKLIVDIASYEKFKDCLIGVSSIGYKYNLDKIRDTYVAHTDKSRIPLHFDINAMNEICKLLAEAISLINQSIFKTSVNLNQSTKVLSQLIRDNILLGKFISNERSNFFKK